MDDYEKKKDKWEKKEISRKEILRKKEEASK